MSNVSRLGLQKEHEISVFLRLVVVGEDAFFHFGIIKMAGDFVLLQRRQKRFIGQASHRVFIYILLPAPCGSG